MTAPPGGFITGQKGNIMEKEQVINALENCIGSHPCKNCPYENGYQNFPSCAVSLMKEALVLIKEQDSPKEYKDTDFTSDELMLLKMAFHLVGEVVEIQRESNYDVCMCNALHSLKEKLGIL